MTRSSDSFTRTVGRRANRRPGNSCLRQPRHALPTRDLAAPPHRAPLPATITNHCNTVFASAFSPMESDVLQHHQVHSELRQQPASSFNLSRTNSPRNACSTFTSRSINVHLRDFKQQFSSKPTQRRQLSLPTGHAKAQPGSPVRQSLSRAVRLRHFAASLFAVRDHSLRLYHLHFQLRRPGFQPARRAIFSRATFPPHKRISPPHKRISRISTRSLPTTSMFTPLLAAEVGARAQATRIPCSRISTRSARISRRATLPARNRVMPRCSRNCNSSLSSAEPGRALC